MTATDPEGATLSYTLVGGNGSFEVDETTGELFYTGTGEDLRVGDDALLHGGAGERRKRAPPTQAWS